MKSFEDIEKLVRDSRIQATRATDERVLQNACHALKQTGDFTSQGHTRTRSYKYWPLKVAGILLVVGISIFSWLIPGQNNGVVLADIQKAIQLQNTVFVTGTRTCIYPLSDTEPNEVYTYRTEKWASDAGYIDKTYDLNGQCVFEACYHFDSGTITLVYHELAQYYRFHVSDTYKQKLRSLTLMGILETLFQAGDHTNLGVMNTDAGEPAQCFEVTDFEERIEQTLAPAWMRIFFLNIKQSKARFWVSLDTKLPVAMKGHFVLDGCLLSDFMTMELVEVSDHWVWAQDMSTQSLRPEKPAGYQSIAIPGE